ncbi:unnamed protein product [Lactuca saligna]|uniref:Protein kinase domain-containing protein n=1 Tax=Lactuca saligna TaxID=75948 RepID=A0AA35YP40_LACSI|nr:unnamed protein product [Lactuca saligna]
MSLIRESLHLRVPFRDIEIATKNFTTIIGKGGYGFVYKGDLLLSNKLTSVAVKRLENGLGQGLKEFLTEIQMLSHYKHPNLVSLLGYCEEGHEKILIYEYAERGSLDRYLSKANSMFPLPWKQRINVCIDAARGLDYLHNHVAENQRVIHRDIKSANILLDHNWKAMIADLGLSKLGRANEIDTYLVTNACGTQGYCDPVYIETGILTKESDIYSFGVVLFEVLCGRLGFMKVNNESRFLAPLARSCYEKGTLNDIIDLDLKNQVDSNSLNTVSEIAYQCLKNDRKQRPSMSLVVEKLVRALELQELAEASESQVLQKKNQRNNNENIWPYNQKKEKASGFTLVDLEMDLHCVGCARKVIKEICNFKGVESVGVMDLELKKLTVSSTLDPVYLRQKVEKKTKKKVNRIFPSPKTTSDGRRWHIPTQMGKKVNRGYLWCSCV